MATPRSGDREHAVAGTGPVVVIVADDPDIRLVVRVSLEVDGCRVLSGAESGEGVACRGRCRPDVMVLDAQAPGPNRPGDVLDAAVRAGVAVVVLSRDVSAVAEIEWWQRGAAAFLPMPFAPEDLACAVRHVVEQSPADRERRRVERLDELVGR